MSKDKKQKKSKAPKTPDKQRLTALREWAAAWLPRFGVVKPGVLEALVGQKVTVTNAPEKDSERPPTTVDVWVVGYSTEKVFPEAFTPGKEDVNPSTRLSIITVDGKAMWLSKGATITYKVNGEQKTAKVK